MIGKSIIIWILIAISATHSSAKQHSSVKKYTIQYIMSSFDEIFQFDESLNSSEDHTSNDTSTNSLKEFDQSSSPEEMSTSLDEIFASSKHIIETLDDKIFAVETFRKLQHELANDLISLQQLEYALSGIMASLPLSDIEISRSLISMKQLINTLHMLEELQVEESTFYIFSFHYRHQLWSISRETYSDSTIHFIAHSDMPHLLSKVVRVRELIVEEISN